MFPTEPIATTLENAYEPIPGCKISYLAGRCPLQGEGTICGRPFYFRARHEGWELSLSLKTDDPDPCGVSLAREEGYTYRERYGRIGEHDAGCMSIDQGVQGIIRAAWCLHALFTYQDQHPMPSSVTVLGAMDALSDQRYELTHTPNNPLTIVEVALHVDSPVILAEVRCLHPDMAVALSRAWQVLQCNTPFFGRDR